MGDDSEWIKCSMEDKCLHKVSMSSMVFLYKPVIMKQHICIVDVFIELIILSNQRFVVASCCLSF